MKTFRWIFLFYLLGINSVAFLFSYIFSNNTSSSIFLNESVRSVIFSALGGNIGTLSFLYLVKEERANFILQLILWSILLYQILFAIWVRAIFKKKNKS